MEEQSLFVLLTRDDHSATVGMLWGALERILRTLYYVGKYTKGSEIILMRRINNKNTLGIALMMLCSFCLCGGQFIWKYYEGLWALAIGFFIYGFGALAMLCAYRFGRLSTLQPLNSISYVISIIIGYIAFQETINIGKIMGVVSIMIGVVLLVGGDLAE